MENQVFASLKLFPNILAVWQRPIEFAYLFANCASIQLFGSLGLLLLYLHVHNNYVYDDTIHGSGAVPMLFRALFLCCLFQIFFFFFFEFCSESVQPLDIAVESLCLSTIRTNKGGWKRMEAERIFLFLMPLPLPSSRICFLFKYMTRSKMQILLATPHFCAFHDLCCFSSFSSAPFEFLCLSFLSFFLHCLPKCKAPLYYPLHLNVEFSLSHLACMYTCMYNTALRKTAHAKQDGISSPDFSLLIFF